MDSVISAIEMISDLTAEFQQLFLQRNFKKLHHTGFPSGQVLLNPETCQLASELLVKMGKEINRDRVLVNSLIFPRVRNVAGKPEPR